MSNAVNCVQPGFDYFNTKFLYNFTPSMIAFISAHLINPGKVNGFRN